MADPEPPSRKLASNLLVRSAPVLWLSRVIFRMAGWRAVGEKPAGIPKFVMICAPHTSYWDGFWMLGTAAQLGLDLRFLMKHTSFRGPFGILLKSLGAVPVIRTSRQNTVQAAAEWFRTSPEFLLGVAPEGTRKLTEGWKTGFYWIAVEAKVPIVCGFIDYGTKTGGLLPGVIEPSGDIKADFEKFRAAYAHIVPKFKAKQSPITPIAAKEPAAS
jgi:1-acyl-sn-glycerol-3-phosphate acyltransferase